MGLDSVELVMEWEKYFSIQIPDREAEKINTVQDAVNTIAMLLEIDDEAAVLRNEIFSRLKNALRDLGFNASGLESSDLVSKIFPENKKEIWASLSQRLELKIPPPPGNPEGVNKSRVWKLLQWAPQFRYDKLTFSEFTDAICTANIAELVYAKDINSKYEIYIAIAAVTVEKIGVDVYEIRSDKTFTGDFGID